MSADWYRNTSWDEAIERGFEEKLRRARRKADYLRVQACTLAETHPEVAIRLLQRYFALGDKFDQAQAYVDQATALLALGRLEEAISSYESALAREVEYPNVSTAACLDLPYLLATRRIRPRYQRAIQLLEAHKERLMFPVDRFRWHAARALIAADIGDTEAAKVHAGRALDAASLEHSGLRYHATLGLVTEEYGTLVATLKGYRTAV